MSNMPPLPMKSPEDRYYDIRYRMMRGHTTPEEWNRLNQQASQLQAQFKISKTPLKPTVKKRQPSVKPSGTYTPKTQPRGRNGRWIKALKGVKRTYRKYRHPLRYVQRQRKANQMYTPTTRRRKRRTKPVQRGKFLGLF